MSAYTPMWSKSDEELLVMCRTSEDPMVVELSKRLTELIDNMVEKDRLLALAVDEQIAGGFDQDNVHETILKLNAELEATQVALNDALQFLSDITANLKELSTTL